MTEYSADSQFDADLGYLRLAEFARHLILLWQAGRVAELTQAFGAIERPHVDGDDYVREAATLGLLETLQNNASIRTSIRKSSQTPSGLSPRAGATR